MSRAVTLVIACLVSGIFAAGPGLAQEAAAPDLLVEAQGRAPLTLAELLRRADADSPTLRIAATAIRRAQAEAAQARLYPNPTIGYQGEQIRGGSFHGGEQGGFLSQTIPLGGKLGLRANIAIQQSHAAEADLAMLTRDVHNRIAEAFFAAVATQQSVPIRRALLANANDAVQTARQLANIGQGDAASILEAEMEAQQCAIDVERAQRMYLQEFAALVSATGGGGLPPTKLMVPVDVVTTPAPDLATNPVMAAVTRRFAAAEARLESARRASVPDLTVTAGAQQNLEALPEAPGKATGVQAFASASVTLPVWNRNQGAIAAAQAEVDGAREEMTRTRLLLEGRAEALRQGLLSARFEATRLRDELVPRATRAHQLYLDAYNGMTSAYAPVIAAQHSLLMLQLRLTAVEAMERQSAFALENLSLDSATAMGLVEAQ